MSPAKLSAADKHYWEPIPQVRDWLMARIAPGAKVLDIGPGHAPLPWATHAVDFVDVPGVANLIKCDLAGEPLPYPDKHFEFVYARHIIEDMFDPFPLLAEMDRVGKAGYIETPSPICELTRGVDGGAPDWRGYHHHRFICWVHQGELRLVSKYPLVEHLACDDGGMLKLIRHTGKYWNSYHLWEGSINWTHRQSPLHFNIPRDYSLLLADAAAQSKAATDEFFARGISEAPAQIASLPRAFA